MRHLPVVALPLNADAAKVGCDIKLVGSDAGEKISIHSTTLSHLDREAPTYGKNTYNVKPTQTHHNLTLDLTLIAP